MNVTITYSKDDADMLRITIYSMLQKGTLDPNETIEMGTLYNKLNLATNGLLGEFEAPDA